MREGEGERREGRGRGGERERKRDEEGAREGRRKRGRPTESRTHLFIAGATGVYRVHTHTQRSCNKHIHDYMQTQGIQMYTHTTILYM